MGDVTLFAVLKMPPELWDNDSPIDVYQRHSRYVYAADEIERLRINEKASHEVIKKWRAERMEMVVEIERLRKLATCSCGDGFAEHDPGTCGNCLAALSAGVDRLREIEKAAINVCDCKGRYHAELTMNRLMEVCGRVKK